jgi:RNA polymerase sigma-70 factor, ECF subfamily
MPWAVRTRLTDERKRASLADPASTLPGEVRTVRQMANEAAGPDFSQLVLVHERQLQSRALCFCRNADEARDLVQDTLVRALKHFPHLRPNSNIRGWLMTIMVNLYRDGQKRRYRSREIAFEEWHDLAEVPPAPAHAALEREELDAAMARLPPDLRELLKMKAVEGLRYSDIGKRLGMPPNTVGTRLRQARKALYQLLGMDKVDAERD